ncbi:exported protein [Oxalobacteraceae bacterium IMCC9480]|nr:exported protein [Oxalobacteraceae bacterium IMCC9480]
MAATEAERAQGLMFREKMGPNEGMIFLFGAPAGVCMWMKNTLLPLSVAFIDDDGKIVNIEDMKPQTTESHCAVKPIRYALEMNAGWFKQKNIKAGMVIDGISNPK